MATTPRHQILAGVDNAILVRSFLESRDERMKESNWNFQGTIVEIKFNKDKQ